MENYFRTYSNLQEQVENLELRLSQIYQEFPELSKLLEGLNTAGELKAVFKFLYGATYFNVDTESALKKFRSNRYFIDALNIDLLPTEAEISKFYEKAKEISKLEPGRIQFILEEICKESEVCLSEAIIDYEFLNANGYLIINNVLDNSLCDELNSLTLALAKFERGSLNGGYVYGSGNMQRVYSLISKAKIYRSILENPIVDCVMKHMFHRDTFHDKYYLTSFHANLLGPDCENQIWHIDANVPDPIPPWIIRSNSNYITQDYSADCGATEIIPGSHKWNRKPNFDEAECGAQGYSTQFLEAPKGSLVFWHGHLWHRSGKNITNKTRVALLGAYAASHMREVSMEENLYLNLDGNQAQSMSNKLKTIVGWNHGSKFYY